MRIARFWARVRVTIDGRESPDGGVVGVGWSLQSEADARQMALERARRAAAALQADRHPAEHAYPYPDRPVREPIEDELRAGDRVVAAITRNSYGSLVLNAAEVMFVDIDQPMGVVQKIASWFRRGHEDPLLERTRGILNDLAAGSSHLGFRVYRTAGGLRVLVTGQTFDPTADDSLKLMRAMHADSRYVQLCRTQACFRARLTPKPWRCGVPRSSGTFPRVGQESDVFDDWLREYERAAADWAVCQLIDTVGSSNVGSDVEPILTWHDEVTCREGMGLA